MEIEELVKIIIFVVVLVVLIVAAIFLFKIKGGAIFDAIRKLFRFGG